MEILEYDLFGPEILRMIPTVNTNGILLNAEDTTLPRMKTKQVVSKMRVKSKLKANTLTEVRSTIPKKKSNTTISRRH